MLASDTQGIADYLKELMINHYTLDEKNVGERFADTRDTLCYATNDNQTAVTGMLADTKADIAIVVGGYNSSNTSHLVELCEMVLPTFFIESEEKILSPEEILHYNFHTKTETLTKGFLPGKQPVKVLITSGASCPDAMVENIIRKLAGFYNQEAKIDALAVNFND